MCVCVVRGLTSTGQVAGQSLVVHEHLSGGGGVWGGVLGRHVSAHHPEAVPGTNKAQKTMLTCLVYVHVAFAKPRF